MGVFVQDVDKKLAKKENLKINEGAYISEVVDDSPADSAGILRGDVVIRFAEQTIENADGLMRAVRKSKPGTQISLVVVRNGEEKNFSIKVGTYRSKPEFMFREKKLMPPMSFMFSARIFGMRLLPLNEQLGEYFGAPRNEGMLVQDVAKQSSAEEAGLKAGDIILQAGKRTVREKKDILREVRKCDEGDTLQLSILRRGEKMNISIVLQESDIEFYDYRSTLPQIQFQRFFGDGEEWMNPFFNNYNDHVEIFSSQDENADSASGDMTGPF